MKKILLIFILLSQLIYSQDISNKSIDYLYYSDTINKKSKVRLLEIIHIKNQFNYNQLDSLQKLKFIDKIILKSFDDFGNLSNVEESSFFDGEISESVVTDYKYDSKNRIYSIICPRYHNKTIYEYENNSENYSYFTYNFDDVKYDKIIKVTVNNGLISNSKEFDESGNFTREEIYRYNNNGQPTFESLWGVKTEYNYLYDSKNRIIEETHYFNNQLETKTINVYDNKKLKTQQINLYSHGKLRNTEISTFKYDEFDNWIEKETTKNNIPNRLIIRKITYLE